MADSACGKNRLPIPSEATASEKACEQTAWDIFKNNCGGCVNTTCVEQLWTEYQNSRAQCFASYL